MRSLHIVGVGLIGSSFALAVKKVYPGVKVYGVDTSNDNLHQARQLGIIDEIAQLEDLANSEMVYLAIPVDAVCEILPKVILKL